MRTYRALILFTLIWCIHVVCISSNFTCFDFLWIVIDLLYNKSTTTLQQIEQVEFERSNVYRLCFDMSPETWPEDNTTQYDFVHANSEPRRQDRTHFANSWQRLDRECSPYSTVLSEGRAGWYSLPLQSHSFVDELSSGL